MTNHEHQQGDDAALKSRAPVEHEFYAEPAQLTRKDVAGVVLALVALTIIGVSGYVWLNPKLSASQLVTPRWSETRNSAPDTATTTESSSQGGPSAAGSSAATQFGASTPIAGTPEAQRALLDAANADSQLECPQCGMVAGASEAEVVAQFTDSSIAYFDSWICFFGWISDQKLVLDDALVLEHGTYEKPHWLGAKGAVFLYDTKRILGSMPPYVAAFADQKTATAAQAELGGQLVEWTGLQQKFEK